MRRFLVVAIVLLCSMLSAQDQQSSTQDQQSAAAAPSLGDIARQLKLKKQQKDAQQAKDRQVPASDAPATGSAESQQIKKAHIVTNDDTPQRASVTTAADHTTSEPASRSTAADSKDSKNGDRNAQAEKWKSEILAQKNQIAAMEQDMKALSDTIHYAGGNCVANCAQWNEHQQQKQQEVEAMKSQLEALQKQLEEMQESARKEGFGSTVYDPSE